MRKFLYLLFILLIFSPIAEVKAENITLQAGVSMSDRVPRGFFGTWKITSTISYTNNKKIFNETTTDYWNLSKTDDVITLTNPVSGAEASVTVEDVKGNQIKFTHVTKHKNAKMTETPTLTLNGENFYGTDKIVIEKYKNGEKVSTDIVVYNIKAQKLIGNSAASIFMSER